MALRTALLPVSCALALLLPLIAQAQEARTSRTANLRAGPDRSYPLVATFPPGLPIVVQGCIDGYAWCDVIGPSGERGWLYAGSIVYPYQTASVPVLGYGAAIGIPIVTFSIGSYWGNYYRQRPWYEDRHRWEHRSVYGGRPPGWQPPPRPPHWNPPPPGPRPGPDWRPPREPRPPHLAPEVRWPPAGSPRPPSAQPGYRPPPAAPAYRPPPPPPPRPAPEARPPAGRPPHLSPNVRSPGER